MDVIKKIKKYKEKEAKKQAKEEVKAMIPTLREQLNELTKNLDALNALLKKITRS